MNPWNADDDLGWRLILRVGLWLLLFVFAVLLYGAAMPTAASAHRVTKSDCRHLVRESRPVTVTQWRSRWHRCAGRARRHNARIHCDATAPPRRAIRCAFPIRFREARRVAWCESRWIPWASNGQYLGIFQMGSAERSRYGHGPTPLEQARAARRYFDAVGRHWGPWACKP